MMRILGAFTVVCGLVLLLAWVRTTDEGRIKHFPPASGHVFENIVWGDTLVLSATYAECGEFGGHQELIRIYMREEDQRLIDPTAAGELPQQLFTATWFVDTTTCPTRSRKFWLAKLRQLRVEDERVVADYLQQLLTAGWQEGMLISNAGHRFSAGTAWGRSKLEFFDTRKQWKGFDELRYRLFGQRQRP